MSRPRTFEIAIIELFEALIYPTAAMRAYA